MMLAMWHGTNNLSTSTKYGQVSRFLLRIIYSDSDKNAYIGDIDREISLVNADNENIEDISQADIDVNKLFSILTENKKKIKAIQFACHDKLEVSLENKKKKLGFALKQWAKNEKILTCDILTENIPS
jgi:CRISPR-associated protein Csh2